MEEKLDKLARKLKNLQEKLDKNLEALKKISQGCVYDIMNMILYVWSFHLRFSFNKYTVSVVYYHLHHAVPVGLYTPASTPSFMTVD